MQVALWSVLHDDVEMIIVTEKLMEFDDVGMIDFTKNRYFCMSLPG